MNIDLLKELTEAHGVSGQEDAVREIVKRELSPVGDLSTDSMGNLTCVKRGSGGGKKLMLAAHMDEIGFIVKFIEAGGFLRLQTLGGWDPRQMNSQRVWVGANDGPLRGVLMYGTKPAHMLTEAESREGQKHDSFFVDLGLSPEEVKEKVRLGDQVTMDRTFMQLGTC